MTTFILLTRLSNETLRTPASMEAFEKEAVQQIHQECPDVKWLHNFAILGRYDYLDIFTAPDMETAMKVSALIRSYGRAHSEIWPATEWQNFKTIIRSLVEH
ncbi:MAG: hypothetical protein K0R08_882 [Solimicrobium sp.]|jgi:uncharacterized protein with GYD domain|nr:hypothetical protein [Solimicrobium sp.]